MGTPSLRSCNKKKDICVPQVAGGAYVVVSLVEGVLMRPQLLSRQVGLIRAEAAAPHLLSRHVARVLLLLRLHVGPCGS